MGETKETKLDVVQDTPSRGQAKAATRIQMQELPDFSLVLGGPLYQAFRRAHLTGPAMELLRRRVVITVLLTWIPLAILSIAQGHLLGGAKLSFLHDIETHVRFLISLPVLILAEVIVHERLRPVTKSFVERHVVTTEELPRFYAAIDSAMRMRNSLVAEIALLLFVFTVGIWTWRNKVALDVTSWYASPQSGHLHLTMAGCWLACVSLPIFQFLVLRWYMRILIWFLFLLRVSMLKLHLLPAHPDRAGGLGFLGKSSFAFGPLLFAQGALLSAEIASRIFYNGQSLLAFKSTIAGFVAFLLWQCWHRCSCSRLNLHVPNAKGSRSMGHLQPLTLWTSIRNGCATKPTESNSWAQATYNHWPILVTASLWFARCAPFRSPWKMSLVSSLRPPLLWSRFC
jgi:hypothetical protein